MQKKKKKREDNGGDDDDDDEEEEEMMPFSTKTSLPSFRKVLFCSFLVMLVS